MERGHLHQNLSRGLSTRLSACLAYQVSCYLVVCPLRAGNLTIYILGCNIEEGMKYAGHNLYPARGKTQDECAALCFHEPECHFWTHNAASSKCWLKKSDKGKSPSTFGSNSGQKACGLKGRKVSQKCLTLKPRGGPHLWLWHEDRLLL